MSASAPGRFPIRWRVAPRLFQASAQSAFSSIALSNSSKAPAKSAREWRDEPKAQWILVSLTSFMVVSGSDAHSWKSEIQNPKPETKPNFERARAKDAKPPRYPLRLRVFARDVPCIGFRTLDPRFSILTSRVRAS